MSKHNDIYNILGKLKSLQPKEQPAKVEAKPIYESVEARGSVLEGVAKVEQTLAEKYMGFKKTVAAIKKGGSAENPEAVAAAIGRKKYGKAKFQKAAAAGKKLGEGAAAQFATSMHERIKNATPAELSNMAYEFGGDAMSAKHELQMLQQAQQELRGGMAGTVQENDDDMPWHGITNPELLDNLIQQAKAMDYDNFYDENSRLLDDPREFWENYHEVNEGDRPHPKELEMDAQVRSMQIQQRADKAEKKLSAKRAEPKTIGQKIKKDIGEPLKKLAKGDIKGALSEEPNEEMLSPKDKKFAALAEPKDKITYADKIAGAKKKNEGNLFTGNLAKARAQGKKEADLDGDGDMEKVREGWDEMMKAAKERSGPQPSGGSGIKAGKRYGGAAQKDDEGDKEEATADAPKKRGRPKKDKFAESEMFEKAPPGAKAERMVKHIKKGYAKDGKLTPKEKSIAYATAWKAHNKGKLDEGVIYEGGDQQVDHILNRFKNEVKRFQAGDNIDDDLYMALYDYYLDQGEMPYGVAKGRDGDPYQWIEERLESYLDGTNESTTTVQPRNPALGVDALSPAEKLAPHAGVGKGPIGKAIGSAVTTAKNVGRFIQGKPEIPTLEDQELNELARLAGLTEAKKCNHTMEGKSCPVHGLKECGSMNEAKPDFLDLDNDGNKKESMKKAAKEKVDECGPGTMSPMSAMGQDEGSLSINTSMNSDGTKSVSVNATGNQADALSQLLKMAGIGGSAQPQSSEEQVEEERTEQYANTPEEEMETVDAIMHQGNDLNREKEQYADRPKAGDNPMATPTRESVEMPKRISRMLEGIKKVVK